ncbi:hypothetical protein EVAR_40049_1 [Eumeta japonica]|uniref:Reverse transcriptase domain-containing protein n=1 Tax=Eumeta variegata TaxID=151549 RepID=A0A4C1W9E1_EUMVA|nr:hypothetical protein EVAR_40049_1 [Eumeta japonica]
MHELSVKCLLYSDHQVILAPPVRGLQEMANKVNDSVKKRDMKVNVDETKVMVSERGESTIECDLLTEVEMPSLHSVCGGSRKNRCRNSEVRERRVLKEVVVIRVERSMLRWFGHLERMYEIRLTKQIYTANVRDGKVGKGRPRKFYANHISDKLKRANFKHPTPTTLH